VDFVVKRYKRIFPGFWVSILVCGFVFVPLWYFIKEKSISNFWSQNALELWKFLSSNLDSEIKINSVGRFVPVNINGTWWTIHHELRAYIFLGILGFVGLLNSYKRWFVLAITIFLNLIRIHYSFNPEFANFYGQWFGDERILLFISVFMWGVSLNLFKNLLPLKWSGFLITASYVNTQDIFVFLKKRLLRLAPAYWMCLILTVLLFPPLYYVFSGKNVLDYFVNDLDKGWQYFWANVTTEIKLTNFGTALDKAGKKEFNGPLWSLIFEVRAYILLGLLGIFKNKFLILIPAIFFWFSHYNVVFNSDFRTWFGIWVGDYKIAILFSYFFVASAFYIWKDKISMDWKILVPSLALTFYGIYIDQFSLFAPLFLTYCVIYIAHKIPTPK
jgi:peptidoglycan/LPS O-acetylase OafA/YrhL